VKRLTVVLVRAFWLGLLPLFAALAAFAWLVPGQGQVSGGWARLAELALRHDVLAVFALFVIFALLVRYWHEHLPGARYLEAAPKTAPLRLAPVAAWLLGAAVLAFGLRSLVLACEVESSSMLPTLQRGDRLLVNRAAYGLTLPLFGKVRPRSPKRGELVVFRRELDGAEQLVVKRVVGLPGDRIAMHGPVPIINGKEATFCVAGRYATLGSAGPVSGQVAVEFIDGQPSLAVYSPNFEPFEGEYVVAPGELFVLGDNRSSSQDSRAWHDGRGVPLDRVVGRAERLLVGARQHGQLEPRTSLRSIGLRLETPGIDSRDLQAAIDRCAERAP
jgi:signal peptidase I